MRRLIEPASIAVVGASARPGSFGHSSVLNLSGYGGRVHLVNARHREVSGRPCHASLEALPEVPDCAVIAVPADQVEETVHACARRGVGAAVVFASGFAELGTPDGVAAQQRLVGIARDGGMLLVGPNCMGLTNYLNAAAMTFATGPMMAAPRPGAIGLVSQSGALSFALSQAIEHGVAFSHALSAGNSGDVDVADYVAYLALDPGCAAVACTFEGLSDPARMIEAAMLARARGKPMVVLKIATGEQGAAAAMSHTGSLAGSNEVWRAAFERAGVVMVEEFEDLVETASFLAKAPAPTAPGVAVVSTSGGAAILAADKAELAHLPMPQPLPATEAALLAALPGFGSARNPCDVTAQALNDLPSFRRCVEALLADPQYGVLVVPVVAASETRTLRIPVLDEVAREQGKAACLVWLTQWMEGPGSRIAEECGRAAIFRSMRSCFAALAHWQWWWQQQAQPPLEAPVLVPQAQVLAARRVLREADGPVLTEGPAKALLAGYGVPMVQDALVQGADEAVAAAARIGWPVALKVESGDIPHKTEAGVVRLAVADERALRAAWGQVMDNALRVTTRERVRGVLVQPMVPAGLELLVGARIDPVFGATVVVGLGGILVELLRDTVVTLAPLDRAQALQALRRLKGHALLQGFRGSAPVDLERLTDIVCRVAQFAHDHRDLVAEIDLNPLICHGAGIVGVDALISLAAPAAPATTTLPEPPR